MNTMKTVLMSLALVLSYGLSAKTVKISNQSLWTVEIMKPNVVDIVRQITHGKDQEVVVRPKSTIELAVKDSENKILSYVSVLAKKVEAIEIKEGRQSTLACNPDNCSGTGCDNQACEKFPIIELITLEKPITINESDWVTKAEAHS